jgi:hypothetical protein
MYNVDYSYLNGIPEYGEGAIETNDNVEYDNYIEMINDLATRYIDLRSYDFEVWSIEKDGVDLDDDAVYQINDILKKLSPMIIRNQKIAKLREKQNDLKKQANEILERDWDYYEKIKLADNDKGQALLNKANNIDKEIDELLKG